MLVTCGDVIKFWDPKSYDLKQVVPSSYGNVKQVSWNHDGGCLGIVSEKSKDVSVKMVKGYSAMDYSVVKRTNPVSCISFARRASHAQFLAVADGSNKVLVWDIKQNCQSKLYTIKDCPSITSISFSTSDSHIAAGSTAGSVYLMSATNNTVSKPHAMFADKSRVVSLRYGTVKRSVLGVTSSTGKVSVLDANMGVVTRLEDSHSAPCSALAFSPINEILMVSVGYDKKMVCHNLRTNQKAMHLSTPTPLTCATFLPGGVHVCLGSLTGEVFLYDIRTINEPIKRWQAHTTAVTSISLQPSAASDRKTDSSRKRTDRKEKTEPNATVPSVKEVTPPAVVAEEGKRSQMEEYHDFDVLSPVKEYYSNVPTKQAARVTPMKLKTFDEKFDSPVDDVLSPVGGVLSPVNGSTVLSPVKGSTVLSPVKGSTVLSPVKGSCILPTDKRSIVSSSDEESVLSPVKQSLEPSSHMEVPVQPSQPEEVPQGLNTSVPNAEFVDYMISPVRNSKYLSMSVISPVKDEENVKSMKNTSVHHQNIKENVSPIRLIENESLTIENVSVNVKESAQPNRKKLPLRDSNSVNILRSNGANSENSAESTSRSMAEIQKKYNKIVNRMKSDELQSNAAKTTEQSGKDASHLIDYEKLSQLVADKLKAGQSEQRGSSSLSTSLVSNAVKDLLEDVEANINKRFMHLQYTMITHFITQTKELEELHKKYSLNEALVEENLKLQEEIKHLKRQY